jgi:hypothetical protein
LDVAAPTQATTQAEHPFDATRDLLLEMLQSQARTMGVPHNESSEAKSPAQILPRMITLKAQQLSAANSGTKIATDAAQLIHEIRAAEFLASDDLTRYVILQRTWAQTLALMAVEKNASRKKEAQETLDALASDDARDSTLLKQMHGGERAILKLWQVVNKP